VFISKLNLTTLPECTGKANCEFTTPDGIVWNLGDFLDNDFKEGNPSRTSFIMIDVNGPRDPNCFQEACAAGIDPDRFRIHIQPNGKMFIDERDETARAAIHASAKVQKEK